MLHIYYGNVKESVRYPNFIWNVQGAFDRDCTVDWLFTDFAKEIISVVDKSDVDPCGILVRRKDGRRYNYFGLSGGTKCALWLKYGYKSGIVHASFGDNVVPYIEQVGMEKDVWLQMKYKPRWQFTDPKGIYFVGLGFPTRVRAEGNAIYWKRIMEVRREEEAALSGED